MKYFIKWLSEKNIRNNNYLKKNIKYSSYLKNQNNIKIIKQKSACTLISFSK